MENFIENILTFLGDNSLTVSKKTWVALLCAVLLLVLDNGLGFTYNLHISNKLDQLTKIQVLKPQYITEPSYLAHLKSVENNVLYRKHYSEIFTASPNNNNNMNTYHLLWCCLSTSAVFLFYLLSVAYLVATAPKDYYPASSLFGIAVFGALLLALTVAFTALAAHLPLLNATQPYLNYIAYAFFQIAITLLGWAKIQELKKT